MRKMLQLGLHMIQKWSTFKVT